MEGRLNEIFATIDSKMVKLKGQLETLASGARDHTTKLAHLESERQKMLWDLQTQTALNDEKQKSQQEARERTLDDMRKQSNDERFDQVARELS